MFEYLFNVIYNNSTPKISCLTRILFNSFNAGEYSIENKFAFYEKTNTHNIFISSLFGIILVLIAIGIM